MGGLRTPVALVLLVVLSGFAFAGQSDPVVRAIEKGDYPAAIELSSKLIVRPDISRRDRSVALAQRAYALVWTSNSAEAEKDIGDALTIAPDKDARGKVFSTAEQAFYSRAEYFNDQQKWAEAVANYTAALKYDFDDPGMHAARAKAYLLNRQPDAAIDDFDIAINADGSFPEYFLNRGGAYEMKLDFARAISNYNDGLGVDPRDSVILGYRGRAYALTGNYQLARRDLEKALLEEPEDTSSLLWLHIVRMRTGQNDISWLKKKMAKTNTRRWPAPVLKYFSGKMSAEGMLNIALTSADTAKMHQRCDGWFYLGEEALARKDVAHARTLFKKTVSGCDAVDYEWIPARMELAHIADW